MGLEINLQLGKWAKQRTQQLVPFSTNKAGATVEQSLLLGMVRRKHPKLMKHQIASWSVSPNPADNVEDHHNRFIGFTDNVGYRHIDTLGNFTFWMRSARLKTGAGWHSDGTVKTFFHDVENNAKNSIKYGIGNCGELSAIAFLLLLECPLKYVKGEYIRVEKINITYPGDHCFVIIGREASSDLRDPSTWGPDAVICDPWGNINVAVQGQLSKKRSARIPIFNYILDNLADKDLLFRALDYNVGAGHSGRWKMKNRGDLRFCSDYSSKPQNIPFFNTGGFKLNASSAGGAKEDERVVPLSSISN
ncbi:hypothetical protein [Legionella jordanis]|uniref:Uncharacterized protein n=1 Tax=Legionella jordanis TaxID=456 RepID=A0A0W0VE70_9GAMM|nr:hypothetical protein [Legionella jordanis]KTD18444.1 hypothetical protein Ljor_2750 [Legionella jordanis]RMX05349.1 hypothetical protein EAW55_01435 [Legionella jordanis]RMX20802.1 hypothetical protein EAS68_05625 [Legionella jordanis]VEH13208.1 Uncharacterised protein [Legionella jordanis]HAT8715017.1 hypothetical protein [Legionella jordanis]